MAKSKSPKKTDWKSIIIIFIIILASMLAVTTFIDLFKTGKPQEMHLTDTLLILLPALLIGLPIIIIEFKLLSKAAKKQQDKLDILREKLSVSNKILDEGTYTCWKENRNYYVFLTEKEIVLFPLTKLNHAAKKHDFDPYLTAIHFSDLREVYLADSKVYLKTEDRNFAIQNCKKPDIWTEYLTPYFEQ